MTARTIPDVFIIESLKTKEEQHNKEGEIIYRSLRMSGKMPIYHYVRTKRELEHFIAAFEKSRYRSLHISCHGNIDTFATTFDVLDDAEMVSVLGSAIDKKRLFLSTCLAATSPFAAKLFKETGCISVAGPSGKIDFDDSAVLWTAFYHMMFKANPDLMKHGVVKMNLARAALMLNEEVRFFLPTPARKPLLTTLPPKEKRVEEDDL